MDLMGLSGGMAGRVRRMASAVALVSAAAIVPAGAQSLTVLPVNIEMLAGQMATTLTVLNRGDSETSIQVRALAWDQHDGQERLSATDEIIASPPIATVPAGGTQTVRLVLRRPAQGKEGSYRILVDQIPAAATPGTVRIALRLSIPVFAQAATRALPRLQYRVETSGGQSYLVLVNEGDRHEKLSKVVLFAGSAKPLGVVPESSPYVLAGATTRRRLAVAPGALVPGTTVRLTTQLESGSVDLPVSVVAAN